MKRYLLFTLIIAVFGCNKAKQSQLQVTDSMISGKIINKSTGLPIENCAITLDYKEISISFSSKSHRINAMAFTNKNGEYTFIFLAYPGYQNGTTIEQYELNAEHFNYKSQGKTFQLTELNNKIVDSINYELESK